jgi:hypothetical protein
LTKQQTTVFQHIAQWHYSNQLVSLSGKKEVYAFQSWVSNRLLGSVACHHGSKT